MFVNMLVKELNKIEIEYFCFLLKHYTYRHNDKVKKREISFKILFTNGEDIHPSY